ncbi:hypothetical protein [Streptomyces roseoviridis]|uniref:Uncharacterized protein n=1 Tax=Streptomyces roseoviridis TaxID=67361 RepID=A0ABV5QY78_9ACTN
MPATALVRVSSAARAAPALLLALVLTLLCGACAVAAPADPAGGSRPMPPHVQQLGAGPGSAQEIRHRGDGELETPCGSALHRDRRRAALAPAGPPGPPAAAVPAAPRTDTPAGPRGLPDGRPRPATATGPAVLQVFLC